MRKNHPPGETGAIASRSLATGGTVSFESEIIHGDKTYRSRTVTLQYNNNGWLVALRFDRSLDDARTTQRPIDVIIKEGMTHHEACDEYFRRFQFELNGGDRTTLQPRIEVLKNE